jgi:hypothetical protein
MANKYPMPYFGAQKRPEPVAIVAQATLTFFDELADCLFLEVATA